MKTELIRQGGNSTTSLTPRRAAALSLDVPDSEKNRTQARKGLFGSTHQATARTEVLESDTKTSTGTEPVVYTVTGDLSLGGKTLSEGTHSLADGTTLTVNSTSDGQTTASITAPEGTKVQHKVAETTSRAGQGEVIGNKPVKPMLVLSRQRDESIIIGDNIVITVVDIRGDKVRLGINAPTEIPVHRQEVYEAVQRENQRASGTGPDDAEPTNSSKSPKGAKP